MKLFFVFTLFLMAISSKFQAFAEISHDGFFSGRVAKINTEAGIVRVKVDFENAKYVNAKDKVEFWDEHNLTQKCKSYVVGKTNDFLLLKVPEFKYCEKFLFMTTGAYLNFYSEDLKNNLIMGSEVVGILIKKRLSVEGLISTKKKEIESYDERVGAINARYKTLRDKLEQEWKNELTNLEEDKTVTLQAMTDLERRKDEIDFKLEQYKISDDNLKLDRWSLDSRLYFKK